MGFESGAGEFMQWGTYSAAQLRRSVFAWAARTAANTPGLITGGLLSPTDMQLSAAVSGLVVYTSVGECLIGGSEATSQGGYHGFLSSQNSTTLATANASNPRIDLICATAADSSYTIPSGGTSGFVTIQGVTGTATSGATLLNLSGAPALPLSSLLLGYVLVPAAATSLTGANIQNMATVVPLGWTSIQSPAWTSYSPGVTSTGGALNMGSTGSTIAKYLQLGKTCMVRVNLNFAGTAINGGAGPITLSLPFATKNDGSTQTLSAYFYDGTSGHGWSGGAWVSANSSTANPWLPQSVSNPSTSAWADQSYPAGGASTGVPLISGQFSIVAGANFELWGTYETN